ncbi:MAG: serine/threonine protein kinase [Acidiferrobacterales bacterium]
MKEIPAALPNGFLLATYRIEKTLGGGGFSIVYLATDVESGAQVAIKEYLPLDQARRLEDASVESISGETSTTFRKGIKRFFDEAAALAKVSHPNIVHVTDFFRANNTVYLVMEYERGKDLRSYIKRHAGRLSEKFIRKVFPQLLLGLYELHKNQLLHLDIKPANIYLRPGGRPLLLDFGAARMLGMENEKPQGPHTLTLGFAPIEQHRHREVGPWTDLYAIGATMWACMSGRAPPPATERAVRDTFKPAVRAFPRRYSKALLEAVDWCLLMDSAGRPQSVQELLDFMNQSWLAGLEEGYGRYLQRLLLVKLPWVR